MKNLDLKVRFEVVDHAIARAFVNDRHVGNLTFKHVPKNKSNKLDTEARLVFRCSKNPFKNVIPRFYPNYDYVSATFEEALEAHYNAIVPIVIRNALRNYSV